MFQEIYHNSIKVMNSSKLRILKIKDAYCNLTSALSGHMQKPWIIGSFTIAYVGFSVSLCA